jgi:hypothetical protein
MSYGVESGSAMHDFEIRFWWSASATRQAVIGDATVGVVKYCDAFLFSPRFRERSDIEDTENSVTVMRETREE